MAAICCRVIAEHVLQVHRVIHQPNAHSASGHNDRMYIHSAGTCLLAEERPGLQRCKHLPAQVAKSIFNLQCLVLHRSKETMEYTVSTPAWE